MTENTTRTVYTVETATGCIRQCGDSVCFDADYWGGDCCESLDAARAAYAKIIDVLPRNWTIENNCSNGRFALRGGAMSVRLSENTEEWDEDAEEWFDVGWSNLIAQHAWDGENWND